jgi:hypothetical protein
MPNLGTITLHNARASGIQVSELGSGVADHLGFFGLTGHLSAVEVGSWQDTTFIVDNQGNLIPHLGAESGQLTNVKFIDTNNAQVSGFVSKLITDINVFDPGNLLTEPEFANQTSGTLLIRYEASGTTPVRTFNAQMWAYDADTGNINDAPEDVTVSIFEINASGQFFNSAVSGVWKTAHGLDNAYPFTNHSSLNGWQPATQHIWVACISTKALNVGVLDGFNLAFSMQFA